MIQQITVRNFKSIGDVTVRLSPMTVLIGRSGVGKSNFLRAIRFLRNYLLEPDRAVGLEGGWPKIWPFGTPAPLSFSVIFEIPGFADGFTYDIDWKSHQHHPNLVSINRERLGFGPESVFERDGGRWIKWPGEGAAPTPQARAYLNSFPTVSEAVLAYTAWTTGIGWHDFPARVFTDGPGGGQPRVGGLDDTAANYLEVIREITQDLRDQKARRQIIARIKQINLGVDSLELDSILQPQRVIVGHKVGNQKIGLDLSQESDGFRRYYAHLLALYQTPPKQVLMFEEPENGIYPGALRNLAAEFESAHAAGRGQVLLTTQSPDLLDGVSHEQIRVVELNDRQLTKIGPLDPAQADAVREGLLEAGELLTVDTARTAE